MHYAIWALAYTALSFVASIGVGQYLAAGGAGPQDPLPARARGRS